MSSRAGARLQHRSGGGYGTTRSNRALATVRPAILTAARLCLVPLASAAPLHLFGVHTSEADEDLPKDADDPSLWIYLSVAVFLVLLGGVFAGLTIALMGQDETYLQVIATSGEGSEKRHAAKVLKLLNKGKHWVLVTLLLSNVITNETLPIVLDRSLGGGWPAVVSSTVLIVIFGEVAPQSVCVRYGLSIGAFMAPAVLALMWIMSPVAWPTAKLLDYLLGEEHGTMYKKAGLKTLVTLHKTLGGGAGEQLMEDEVTIINSVLDLKDKPVGDIMTPMQDVFTMSADTVLDERMMDTILSQGYSRIPIYAPDNSRNFIGMLLVKILITYDPEDCKRVRDFALATLPETAPHTSCLDIINFFQEGKSHMVLVSDFPGQDKGATGVVTLEDVIEELIGEEIIDESDVFVDVHKAIRRMAPAPKTRFRGRPAEPGNAMDDDDDAKESDENQPLLGKKDSDRSRNPSLANGQTTFMMRRKSSAASDLTRDKPRPVAVRSHPSDLKEHLKHLGPSNAASHPKSTKFTSVKIKPGVSTIPENKPITTGEIHEEPHKLDPNHPHVDDAVEALKSGRPRGASGGAAALYGTMTTPLERRLSSPEATRMTVQEANQQAKENASPVPVDQPQQPTSALGRDAQQQAENDDDHADNEQSRQGSAAPLEPLVLPEKMVVGAQQEIEEDDQVGELGNSTSENGRGKKRLQARSGSITESTIEVGGMKKVVLETTSSSEDGSGSQDGNVSPGTSRHSSNGYTNGEDGAADKKDDVDTQDHATGSNADKKKRKKRGKRKKGTSSPSGD
ncbi:Putative ancient domain protein family [Septoria linicola]|uniref:Ancient domain protein family n=1 Tax=Septoria linicola TaxID=215465 RepID=A0A9Q9AFW2_9PEZI|nr:Putative ancient domain protein family [Septoria linicola]